MWSLCMVEPQKQATSGLQKKWREFRPCRSHFFEAKRPHSTQRVREEYGKNGESSVYANGCFLLYTGYTVRSRCESCQKKWRAFRPYKWLFCTMLRPHSTQRARKLPGKELREFRPCRMCSMQLTQELSQKMARALSMRIVIFPTCDGRHYDSSASVNENIKHKWSGDGVGGMA